MKGTLRGILAIMAVACLAVAAPLQEAALRGRIRLAGVNGSPSDGGVGVVWLTPLSPQAKPGPPSLSAPPSIVQRNKRFETRLLVVEVGTVVDFPNLDPFFHNVFSMYEGKRFDLGLYEAGSTKSVRFDRPGVAHIFCNIHPQMSATVVAVDTPYFATTDADGRFQISGVPPGRYRLHVWTEAGSPESLDAASRELVFDAGTLDAGTILVARSGEPVEAHTNKYGRDYDTPVFSGPLYAQP